VNAHFKETLCTTQFVLPRVRGRFHGLPISSPVVYTKLSGVVVEAVPESAIAIVASSTRDHLMVGDSGGGVGGVGGGGESDAEGIAAMGRNRPGSPTDSVGSGTDNPLPPRPNSGTWGIGAGADSASAAAGGGGINRGGFTAVNISGGGGSKKLNMPLKSFNARRKSSRNMMFDNESVMSDATLASNLATEDLKFVRENRRFPLFSSSHVVGEEVLSEEMLRLHARRTLPLNKSEELKEASMKDPKILVGYQVQERFA
jgi:hypothetical protein